jgi:2-furoyl-CoA dehydrogenase large subunit
LPGLLEAAILRSPYAHALIKRIDYSRALEILGVHGVITGADVVPLIEPARASTYPAGGEWYYIATDRVRYVGDIVAIVAAVDRYIAEDALEAIEVEYEPLPVVSDPEHAADPDQPILHPETPGGNEVLNEVHDYGDVDAAFAEADVVVSERFVVHRHSGVPLEGLAAIASHDPTTGEITMWVNLGNLGRFEIAARTLRVGQADVRLIVPDVGGSFGIKAWVHQRAVLIAVLARKVGRPVRWTEDRLEHLAASHHGMGRITWIDMAAKRDGTILGMKMRALDDQGAYVAVNEPRGVNLVTTMFGPYRIKSLRYETRAVLTNKVPVASNRGYGRVQPTFAVERAIDRVARELGMDTLEIRMKNLIPAESFPYMTPTRVLYDSGDPPALMRKLKDAMDYDGVRREQAEARVQGRLIGIGFGTSVEGGGPMSVDVAEIVLGPDGRLMVQTPTLAQGQGHETTIAQIVADRFDVDPSAVHVTVQLDTRTMSYTNVSGTYASKFSATGAPAVLGATKKLADQLAEMAANVLDADPREIVFRDGKLVAAGGPERSISLPELARRVQRSPSDFGNADISLHATYMWQPPIGRRGNSSGSGTYAVVCQGAVVEVDPETGVVKILKYLSWEDCGRVINPMIVEGQAMGGTIHGIGWALTEKFVYDDNGQLLTGTFMNYLMSRFSDIPPLDLGHIECPSPYTELGTKGMAEGGVIPAMACIANAVEDAIHHLGGRIADSHMPPELVLRAIQVGRR